MDERDPEPGRHDHVLDLISAVAAGDAARDLISAVAAGDAAREDVVAALRNEGVDALDVLVDVLAQATTKGRGRPQPLDVQRSSNAAGPNQAAKTVHPVPTLPFLLRGTLYDPVDIARFNGKSCTSCPPRAMTGCWSSTTAP